MSKKSEKNLDKLEFINYDNYDNEIVDEQSKIEQKISALENKLLDLEIKETMLNNIITRTNATLENIDPKNFKWIGQTQTNLMKQLESFGLLKDIIIKYEDMVQKYRKLLIDIKEKKINNRLRIASLIKEEEEKESDLTAILSDLQHIIKPNEKNDITEDPTLKTSKNQLLEEIQNELQQEGY